MLDAGTKLGHYEIRSRIGLGGMGEVYLAEDVQLCRKVALKLVSCDGASGAVDRSSRMVRFVREAKMAATLSHPNIAHIYEIGKDGDTDFIAMEFVEGMVLSRFLVDEKPNLPSILRIMEEVADGLAAAHGVGILHRDLKPDNIMVTADRHAKILDFGLAKAITAPEALPASTRDETEITESGTVMGTSGYMSPEQARGRELDSRSDIFSFGSVLFEAITGERAFKGEDPIGTIVRIVRDPAPSICDLEPGLPADLQRIVSLCLEKDPNDRFQSIKDVAIELRSLRRSLISGTGVGDTVPGGGDYPVRGSSTARTPDRPRHTQDFRNGAPEARFPWRLAILGAAALFAVATGWYYFSLSEHSDAQIRTIAVMPFVNASGNAEIEYLSDGITESLINSLSQIPTLSVKARNSVFTYKGKEVTPQQVAKELSVQAILNGRVQQRGDQILLSIELVDTRTGNQLWGDQYSQQMAYLPSLQSSIARDVSSTLKAKLTGADEQRIAKTYTQDTEANQLYMRGRYHWNKRSAIDLRKSTEYFQQAIEKDPTYAMAYAALSQAYILLPVYTNDSPHAAFPKARAVAIKALEIDESLAEAHTALATIHTDYEWNFDAAEKEYLRAIELNPNYATAHQWYGEHLASMGRYGEAVAALQRAQDLDPLSLIINTLLGVVLSYNDRPDLALDQLKKTLEMDPNFARAHFFLGETYERMDRFEEAADEFAKTAALTGNRPDDAAAMSGSLKTAYRRAGPRGYFLKMAEILEAKRDSKTEPMPPLTIIGRYYAEAGDKEKAILYLEKAFAVHEVSLIMLKRPMFDPIKAEPRYRELLRKIGLPE